MKLIKVNPTANDAVMLMDELSETLEKITGNSGRHSFNSEDVNVERAAFVVAYSDDNEAIGCGAIRPYNEEIAEVKRMYARAKGKNIGTTILTYLEQQAEDMGYSKIYLETRKVNERAVAFYEKRGYKISDNYGKYEGHEEAICFEKELK